MEFKFHSSTCHCLKKVISQVQTQEQTQEVRLPDTMPDIGSVLGSWGQVIIRSKEWRGNTVSVSGGVMAWVLYAPEDGTEPRSVEVWIPFQMKWDLPETERDGYICVTPLLKALDARNTSARKIMVRGNVSLQGEALEPVEEEIYQGESVPEDVQLLKRSYPAELSQECGEKLFQLEEELALPAVGEILRYEIYPQIVEQKVMAGRLVFRGTCAVHILYSREDGSLTGWDCEIPYSQYGDLERDYGPNASAWIMPMVTNLELDKGEQQGFELRCGLCAQYVVFDRVMLDVVEDAYSVGRPVIAKTVELKLPIRLDQQKEMLRVNQTLNAEVGRIVDVCWNPDHPSHRQNGDVTEYTVPGQFHVLYLDEEGKWKCGAAKGETVWENPSDPGNRVEGYLRYSGRPQGSAAGPNLELSADAELETVVYSEQGISMVTGLELGEWKEPDANRPSLILRRAGEERLWDIAKACNSTVEAIRVANQLQEEPEEGQMLLIPVP